MTTESYFASRPQNATGSTSRFPSVEVHGVHVFDGSAADAVRACLALTAGGGGQVATANLDFFAQARKDSVLLDDLRNADLVIADGMPVVWLAKLTGARAIQRLAGVDLVGELFAQRECGPLRVAVYGSTAEICRVAIPKLESLGEGARVVHVANPPFRGLTPEEEDAYRTSLQESRPDVVLVALGCPAQERLIARWRNDVGSAAWIGIGGTLDFYGGVRRRAPQAAQRFGFEWLVRMVQEPRRLGRRYLGRDLPALAALAPRCAMARVTRSQRSVAG